MPSSLVSQGGPLAMRRVLAADATYVKRFEPDLEEQRSSTFDEEDPWLTD
jgi:hypothetical protein